MRKFPVQPRPSCHAVIFDENQRFLLVKRGGEPFRGWWGLPGGAVELGETVEQALIREVREETGLDVDIGPFLRYKDAISYADGVAGNESRAVAFHYVILFFVAYVAGGRLQAASDASEARWVRWEERQCYPLVPGAEAVIEAAWPYRR